MTAILPSTVTEPPLADPCLDDAELELLAADGLARAGARGLRIERHIDVCAACRRAVAVMLCSDDDGAAVRPRAAMPAPLGRYVAIETIGSGAMGRVVRAYDPKLRREVALKLLRTARGDASDLAQVIREARAMARLSHPNLVAVHDVDEADGVPFIVMEYVPGETLASWARGRSWRDVLARYIEAAAGLAAAHAAGIVHRDFKPTNVVIGVVATRGGTSARARVTDFGLARTLVDDDATVTRTSDGERSSDATPTDAGTVAGTPAYMAPEQHVAGAVGPATDQYAFGVALYEALYGVRPFAGADAASLLRAKVRRTFQPPRDGRSHLPAWLHDAVMRTLAVDPADRWPSMDALMAALQRGEQHARRRRIAVLVGGVAIVAAGVAIAQHAAELRRRQECTHAGDVVREAWNDDARARVREGLLASGVAHASDSGARVGAALDRHADALAEAWHATCLDGDVHRTWSSSDVVLANWCLEERRTELAALVDELAAADAGVAHGAVVAATRLGRVEPCRDRDALQRAPQPPAAQLDEVLAVRTALASERVRAFVDRREPERLAVVQTLRERAEALAWPPLTARARAFEAKLLARNGDDIGAEREGIAAYFEASRAGAWDVAALAATQLVALLGDKLGRLDEALVWGEHGRTALAHGGDTDDVLDALLTRGIGKVYARQGRHDEARASAAEYLAHVERVFGPEHPSIVPALDELAVAEGLTDDLDAALALHERAVAAGERTLGASHPHLVKPIANLATACLDRGDVSRARALFERALAGATENGPEGALWNNAANADMVAGDLPAARAKYERAREIFVRTWGPDHAAVGATLMNLAGIHRRLGEIETAHRLLAESRSILEQRLGPDHADVGVVLAQQGEIAGLRGERALARDYFERAVDIHARALGTRHHTYAQSVAQLGRWHADAGDTERARALLAQSVAVFADHEGLQQGEAEAREQLAALD